MTTREFYFESKWDQMYKCLDGIYHCKGEYSFKLIDPKYQKYASLIITPWYIDIIENNTGYDDEEAKELMIQDWFEDENERLRERANKLARERRAKNREATMQLIAEKAKELKGRPLIVQPGMPEWGAK